MTTLFWPAAFLLIGLMLIIVEAFVPSGGFIGFSALFCVALSLWHAFQSSTRLGLAFVLVDLAVVPLTLAAAFWLWTRSPMGRWLLLRPPDRDEIDVSHGLSDQAAVVGREGRTLTPLRPSGHVEVEGRRYDGLAEEGFIAEGATVRVVRSVSGRLVVQSRPRVAPPEPPRPGSTAADAFIEPTAFLIEDSP